MGVGLELEMGEWEGRWVGLWKGLAIDVESGVIKSQVGGRLCAGGTGVAHCRGRHTTTARTSTHAMPHANTRTPTLPLLGAHHAATSSGPW